MAERDNLVLDEEIDEDYEPTDKEIEEYAEWLGMDKEKDKDLFWIAKEGLKAPLPKPWKPCQTAEGEIFYFNFRNGESVWDHPCDEHYRKVYEEEKKKRESTTGTTGPKKKKEKKEKKEKRVSSTLSNPLIVPKTKSTEAERTPTAGSPVSEKRAGKEPLAAPPSLFGKKSLSFLKENPAVATATSSSSSPADPKTPRSSRPPEKDKGSDDGSDKLKALEEKLKKEFEEKKNAIERHSKIDLEINIAAAETKAAKQVDELKEQIEEYKNKAAALRTKLEEQEIEKTKVETQNKTLKGLVEDKDAEMGVIRKRLDASEAEVRKCQAQKWAGDNDGNKDLQAEIATLKESLAKKDASDSDASLAQAEKIMVLQKEVDKLTTENKSAKDEVIQSTGQMMMAKRRSADLQESQGKLLTQVAELKEKLQAQAPPSPAKMGAGETKDLRQKVQQLDGEKSLLQCELRTLKRKIEELEKPGDNACTTCESLRQKNKELDERIREQDGELGKQVESISNWAEKHSGIKRELEALKTSSERELKAARKEALAGSNSQGTFDEGYEKGKSDALGSTASFDDGYQKGKAEALAEGKKSGFDEGYEKGKSEALAEGKTSGFDDGYQKGKTEALAEGKKSGFDDGYQKGKTEAHAEGKKLGFDEGYEKGKTDAMRDVAGSNAGFDDGYRKGKADAMGDIAKNGTFDEGYQKGKAEAMGEIAKNGTFDEGYTKGKSEGTLDGHAKAKQEAAEEATRNRELDFERGKQAGLSEGFTNGKKEALRISTQDFEKGKQAGVAEGYANGLKDATRSGDQDFDRGKQVGVAEGYANGLKEAAKTGDQDFEKGKQAGIAEGYANGKREATLSCGQDFDRGKQAGIAEGYANGLREASKAGEQDFDRGKKAGIAEGYADGKREVTILCDEAREKGKLGGIAEGYADGKKELEVQCDAAREKGKKLGFEEGYLKAKGEADRACDQDFERGKEVGIADSMRAKDDARRELQVQLEEATRRHADALARVKVDAFEEAKRTLTDDIRREARERVDRDLVEMKRDVYEDAKREIYRDAKRDAYEKAKRDIYNEAHKDAYNEAYETARKEAEERVYVRAKEEAKREVYDATKQEALEDVRKECERAEERNRMAFEREAEMKVWRVEEEWRQKVRDSLEQEQKMRVQVGETLRQCNDRAFQLEADATRHKNELQLHVDQVRALEHMTENLRAEVRRLQQQTADTEKMNTELRTQLGAKEAEIGDVIRAKKGEFHTEELALKRRMRELQIQEQRLESREKECRDHERFVEEDKKVQNGLRQELAAEQERVRASESAVRQLEQNLKLCSAEMKQHLTEPAPTFAADLHDDIQSLRTAVHQLSSRRHSVGATPIPDVVEEIEMMADEGEKSWDGVGKAQKCVRAQQESLRRARSILQQNQEKWREDASQSGLSLGSQRVLRAVKKVLDAQTENLNEDLRDVRAADQFLSKREEELVRTPDNSWARKTDPVISRIKSLIHDNSVPDDTVARYFPPSSVNSLSDVNVSMVDRWRGVLFSNVGGRYAKAGLVSPRKGSESSSLHHALSKYATQRSMLRDVLRRHTCGRFTSSDLDSSSYSYGRHSMRARTSRPHYRHDDGY